MDANNHVQLNVLPVTSKSWLDYYDSLSTKLKEEPVLNTQVLDDDGRYHFYKIEREFCLARIAEELLPSRYTRDELRLLEASLHEGGKYTGSSLHDPTNFLKRMWAVVRRERKLAE